jgi:hypothetical protein
VYVGWIDASRTPGRFIIANNKVVKNLKTRMRIQSRTRVVNEKCCRKTGSFELVLSIIPRAYWLSILVPFT